MPIEVNKEYLADLENAVAQKNVPFIQEKLAEHHAVDISKVIENLEAEEAKFILEVLDKELSAEIIANLEASVKNKLFLQLTFEEIASYVDGMDSDDAVDVLKEQPIQVREEVLASLVDRQKAKYIIALLNYEEGTAGALMAKEMIKINVNWTVVQCIEEIRRQAEKVEKVHSVYVVDDKSILLGIVSLKRIILATADKQIADIYESEIISVETYQSEEMVVSRMKKYDLEAIPVVNVHGKLLGRITIDDVVDVIVEQAETDRQLMSGISANIEENDSILMLSKARLPWLLIGMGGGILGAQFMSLFEKDLVLLPAMAFFIPLITATGGNVGIQSSSIILQSLANDHLAANYWQRLTKTFLVALINGLCIALIVFLANFLLGQTFKLGLVVSIALFFVVLLASFMGTTTPLILVRFGINPALASGPFITTTNDLLGLAVYFLTARFLYSIF